MKILTKRLEALEMIAVYMTEKARERVVPPWNSSEIVNFVRGQRHAGAEASKETDFECQETLAVCEPLCMRYDANFRTLYYTSECRHTSVVTFGALADFIATCQLLELLTKSSTSFMT